MFETHTDAAREVSERRKVLLPIRLDEAFLQSPQPWAVENARKPAYIADFTGWKDPEAYRAALDRLRQELKPPDAMKESVTDPSHQDWARPVLSQVRPARDT